MIQATNKETGELVFEIDHGQAPLTDTVIVRIAYNDRGPNKGLTQIELEAINGVEVLVPKELTGKKIEVSPNVFLNSWRSGSRVLDMYGLCGVEVSITNHNQKPKSRQIFILERTSEF